ncbi:MAG: zf-HC2 domain-containing protein [Chloroflexota bacterium]
MSNHIHDLIVPYVHRQLSRAQRELVLRHVRECSECYAALSVEQQLVRDLAATMPLVGQPARGQLNRLWPAVWMEFRTPQNHGNRWLRSYSVALVMLLMFAFGVSAVLVGPTQVIAAPFQAAPTQIKATATLIRTDEPVGLNTPEASETVNPLTLPMPSPAPMAGLAGISQIRYMPMGNH